MQRLELRPATALAKANAQRNIVGLRRAGRQQRKQRRGFV
jgi:hypothetical protein